MNASLDQEFIKEIAMILSGDGAVNEKCLHKAEKIAERIELYLNEQNKPQRVEA